MEFDRERDFGFDTYADSVVQCADDDGLLTPGDAMKLVRDHSANWDEWLSVKPDEIDCREAVPLLQWLGY